MAAEKDSRVRLIVGAVIILLGIAALLQNIVANDVATWVWIIALAVSAVIFAWGYTAVKETWAILGTYITGLIALIIFLVTKANVTGNWVPTLVLLGIALPFVVAWWRNRKDWGLLIPAYILTAIVPILWLGENGQNEEKIIPAYVMFVIGLPFLVAYVESHTWPLLLVGGIFVLIALGMLAVGAGLSAQVLTVLVPIVLIAVGAFILLQSWFKQPRKQQ